MNCTALPKALIQFRSKYGFWPHRELARVYWELGARLMREGKTLQGLIAQCHAMRIWPDIINCR